MYATWSAPQTSFFSFSKPCMVNFFPSIIRTNRWINKNMLRMTIFKIMFYTVESWTKFNHSRSINILRLTYIYFLFIFISFCTTGTFVALVYLRKYDHQIKTWNKVWRRFGARCRNSIVWSWIWYFKTKFDRKWKFNRNKKLGWVDAAWPV